jgi:aminopeptidase 2
MLHTYVGASAFRDGLRLYLKQHAYGNTETTDLWKAVEQIAQVPVTQFMEAWTSQAGFPMLRAEVSDKSVELSQARFYLNPATKKDTASVWPIPLDSSIELPETTLNGQSNTIKLPTTNHLLLNKDRGGFYTVLYNPTHLFKLAEAVQAGRLKPVSRLALLSDSFDAAKAGCLSTADALKLLESYANEDSAVVWDIIALNIGSIRAVMDDEALREDMKPYIRKLVAKQLERLGWHEKASDTHFDALMRPLILGMASLGEEPAVVNEALSRFKTMKKPEDIEPDLRGVIYGTAARTGAKAEFDKLLQLHDDSASSEERLTLTAALTGFEQPELIERALSMINSDRVRIQDAGYWIAYSFGNRHAKRMTWDWMIANWQWLEDTMGKDLSFFRMPNYAARAFSDEKFLDEFTAFFGPKAKQPAFERPIAQAIETIQWQSAWRKRDLASIKAFFENESRH